MTIRALKQARNVVLFGCCFFAVVSHAGGEATPEDLKTIVEHQGQTDPKTEGWKAPGTTIRVGDGVETIGDQPLGYWSIADTGGEDGAYAVSLTGGQMSRPWRITLVVRVVDVSTKGTGFGVTLLDGMTYWRLNLTRDGVFYDNFHGQPARYGKALDTTDTYHRYDLVLCPRRPGAQSRADRVTLSVDGAEHARLRRGDFRRMRSARSLAFGSTNSSAQGELRYHLVRFAGDDSLEPSAVAAEPELSQPHPSTVWKPADGTWQIGNSKQLFIDHRFIESSEDVRLVVNPPVKRPGAILRGDKPWDAFRLIFFSIAEDDGVYKMWYQAFDKDQWGGGTPRMCYATSRDGLNWEKPNLGLVEYEGSKDNNILLENKKLGFVFIDPNAKPEQRYKMVYGYQATGHTRVGTSADGVQWDLSGQRVTNLPPGWDTQKQAWWDQRLNKYVVYLRVMLAGQNALPYPFASPIESNPPVVAPKLHRPGRALGRLETDDITKPWPDDEIQTVLTADEIDPPGSDIYHHNVYQYPYAADAYFMFPFTYQHFRSGETGVGNDGVNDAQFCASRDGIRWMRYGRQPYISRGLPGEPDCGIVSATPFHIRKGNYLYQYYSGWPWTHGGFRTLSQQQRQDKANWDRQHYGVVVQRLDGFVSADAPYTGGRLVTPPLVFRGNRLELNIDVAAMGAARVEIQDKDGNPIPEFTLDDCDRILMNDVSYTVRWQDDPDVSQLAGRPVRLKFDMRSAKLYAFQFRGGN